MMDREPNHSEGEQQPDSEPTPKARFDMGQIAVTVGADITLAQIERHPVQLLARHVSGDWGDLVEEDADRNEQALNPDRPTRLFSRYQIDDEIFYVVTEWDRSITTVLRSDEY